MRRAIAGGAAAVKRACRGDSTSPPRLSYDPRMSKPTAPTTPTPPFSAFRPVPRTGVIYVTTEAAKLGFGYGSTDWCNLGQGQPETGPLPGAPPRKDAVT